MIRPPTVDECFRLVDNGTVDGVVEAELVGRTSIALLGLGDKVRIIDQPLALTTLHVLISKAQTAAPNAALGAIPAAQPKASSISPLGLTPAPPAAPASKAKTEPAK